MFLNWAVWR